MGKQYTEVVGMQCNTPYSMLEEQKVVENDTLDLYVVVSGFKTAKKTNKVTTVQAYTIKVVNTTDKTTQVDPLP